MAKAKEMNYTPEMEAEMRAAYLAADSDAARAQVVADLAEKFGRKLQSVRQKLVRMQIYVKKGYVGKNGEKPEQKGAIVGRIANACGANVEAFESLEKANKAVLLKLAAALGADSDEDETESE